MNTHHPSTVAALPESALLAQPPPILRREQLRIELLATVDSLHRRRADLVSEGFIADYVALHWLEWNGGALRLTVTGQNVCAQMRAAMN
ncbi:hypothetical protein [Piscinibacter sp.]|jgi:hypothetical protein|uniref:hypothetical protein n=1 Tax=Piscinibacter sp. TaxID=1903157 RepID=UPI0035594386